jgi:CheY-like chemotaxis protein
VKNFNHQEAHNFYHPSLFENQFPEIVDMDDENCIGTGKNASIFIASPKVLLVEDNLMIQTLHMEMLSLMGCKVDLAEDGHEAMAMANQKAYDVIFMDIGLPKMDGIAATKAIRTQEPKHHRSVIVALTTYSNEIEKACRDAGIDDFYTKPIKKEMLTNILTYWLSDLRSKNF